MPYPTIGEYKDAIRLAEHSFGSLTHLRPEYDATGDLHFNSGNFAVVFKMRDTRTNRLVAVKCFVREQPFRRQRYEQISACLDTLPYSPYLLRYTYHPAEIWVETALSEQREFEVVTLDWVEGQTLYNYLHSRCDAGDVIALRKVAEAFDRLAIWLLEQPFAHGDLKPDNILVTPRGGLVLVDYDGMFTPDMAGQEATELGSPAFRHSRRSLSDFGKHIDHVPILVLSLSLHVLAEHPDWLETYCQGDNLILTANDLSKPESPIFHAIRTQCRAWTTQNRLLGLVNALMLPTLAGMPPVYLKSVPDYDEVKLIPYVKYFKDGCKKWGYCDENKNVIIDFLYDDVYSFHEGLSRVAKNGKWGFIDKTGQHVVPCIYFRLQNFNEGLAASNLKNVEKNRKWGFIDKTGQEIIPFIYDYLVDVDGRWGTMQYGGGDFHEGLSKVIKNGKAGFIDKTGQEIIPCIYDWGLDFSEGLASVKRNGRAGFIDKTGQEIIPFIYSSVYNFSDGLAWVQMAREGNGITIIDFEGFIDQTGQVVIHSDSNVIVGDFHEELASVREMKVNGKWGFIDKKGQKVIPCIFDQVEDFSDGVAAVKKGGVWGFIDKNGLEIIPYIYELILDIDDLEPMELLSNFKYGLSRVKRDAKEFYIGKNGVEYWIQE